MSEATPVIAYLGLGSNQGESLSIMQEAVRSIAALPKSKLVQISSLYQSAGLEGAANTQDFLNAVVALETTLDAHTLLQYLQQIEINAGRERPWRHAPRTLDIDILLYGDAVIDTANLQIPHPRMAQRAFVLRPLYELSPTLVSKRQLLQVAAQKCQITASDWVIPSDL